MCVFVHVCCECDGLVLLCDHRTSVCVCAVLQMELLSD